MGSPIASSHIVLTHVKHKLSVISASPILSVYWEFFERALEEVTELTLFGYSGGDSHINELIVARRDKLHVRVVEWLGMGAKDRQTLFWSKLLHEDIQLVQMENVFDFRDW